MSNFWIIVKKELIRFFTDTRMLASLILPGILIFVMYTIMGDVMTSINSVDENYEYKIYLVSDNENVIFNQTIDKMLEESNVKVEYLEKKDKEIAEIKNEITAEQADLLIVMNGNFDMVLLPKTSADLKIEMYYNSVKTESAFIYSIYSTIFSTLSAPEPLFLVNPGINSDLASDKEKSGTYMSMMLPMLMIIFLFTGVMGIVPESIAGEKERGTIATLLVTPLKRRDLALGKIVSLSLISLCSALSSFLGTILSLPSLAGSGFGALEYVFMDYFYIVLILISLILLFVGILGILSAFSKSIKESSAYATPVMVIVMVIAIISMFGEIPTNKMLYLIPIYNSTMALSSIFAYQADVVGILMAIGTNLIYAILCGFVLTKMFNNEKIMFSK